MRQAGVVAGMGLFAIQHNVVRLKEDHERAVRLAAELHRHGFYIPRQGKIDTNIVYFGLPLDSNVDKSEFCQKLYDILQNQR
jgi:threonine aldolase